VLVGHAERVGDGWASGVTVVVPPPGTVGGVDVRGGGPGTHETDALAPGTLVDVVDAGVLTGGSAFGLASVAGAMRWCEEQGRGVDVSRGAPPGAGDRLVVPVVPAAAVFDLGRGGSWAARPGPDLGYEAAAAAASGPVRRGSVGAGTGALLARGTLKGGVGSASVRLDGGVVVGALAVVNAVGDLIEDAGPLLPGDEPPGAASAAPLNTTLAVVATNLRLDVAATTRMASAGHDGLARALRPVHTLMDGDTVFALATGERAPGADALLDVAAVQAAAADAVLLAVRDAVRSATRVAAVDVPTWAERHP
jgi:putative pantetheine hydrolase